MVPSKDEFFALCLGREYRLDITRLVGRVAHPLVLMVFDFFLSAKTVGAALFVVFEGCVSRRTSAPSNDTPGNACGLAYGTDRTYTYTIFTEPDKSAVDANSGLDGTATNENFNPPSTCATITGNGALNSNGQL